VVWHVPGDNPVSGEYRGEDYFTRMPQRMAPLDEWRFTVTDVWTNEKDLAALVAFHLTGVRRGGTIDMDGHHLIRLDAAGRIVEGWGFAANHHAVPAHRRHRASARLIGCRWVTSGRRQMRAPS